MNYSITQFGKKLNKNKYTFDEKTGILITKESYLVLDFRGIDGIQFQTGAFCTFITGFSCIFQAGHSSYFSVGGSCIIQTTYNSCIETLCDTLIDCSGENNVLVRRDTQEFDVCNNECRQLNEYQVKGYNMFKGDIYTLEVAGKSLFR